MKYKINGYFIPALKRKEISFELLTSNITLRTAVF